MSALAFVLNFDAELELEAGARYQPTASMRERVARLAQEMQPRLPSRSRVIFPLGERAAPDAIPIAWCPTPRARDSIREAGLPLPISPTLEVLTRVNARPFTFELAGDELPGAVLVRDLASANEALARPGAWLLKRCFGLSGRGQRRVRGGETREQDLAFVAASLRNDGALLIEPRVVITRELSVHAWAFDGATHVRSLREQIVDEHGAFVRSGAAQDVESSVRDVLEQTAQRVGAALLAAGYHGPFGVDAYLHRGAGEGALTLRALSEINARYCMGWDEADGWLPPT